MPHPNILNWPEFAGSLGLDLSAIAPQFQITDFGANGDGGTTDDAAAVTKILARLSSRGGTIVIPSGTWTWNSVPALPSGITGRLRIVGAPGAKVVLTQAAPRFLDFGKVADGDTFQNIEISDLLIDANNTTGQNHVILGTYTSSGVFVNNINLDRITLRRIKTINVSDDAGGLGTNHKANVYLTPKWTSAGPYTVTNILCEDLDLNGGDYGVTMGAFADVAANCAYTTDNLVINRCYHARANVPTVGFFCANFQIGAHDQLGYAQISNCIGINSADSSGSILNAMTGIIENCYFRDAVNGCQFDNNRTLLASPTGCLLAMRNIKTENRNLDTETVAGIGVFMGTFAGGAPGNVVVEDWTHHHNTAKAPSGSVFFTSSTAVQKLRLASSTIVAPIISTAATGSINHYIIRLDFAGTAHKVDIDDVEVTYAGTSASSTFFRLWAILLNVGTVNFLNIRNVTLNVNVAGPTGGKLLGFLSNLGTAVIGFGKIAGLHIKALGTDTAAKPIQFLSTGTLTISNRFLIEGCDFTGSSGTADITVDATQTAIGKIQARGNKYKTPPVPTTLAGLVTATGKLPQTYYDVAASFVQGSGAAITAIDWSTNDGTTYTNFLTQASAALPAGYSQTLAPLRPSDLVKVTFTTTQPTVNLVPSNP